jgi:hypothetical protein
LAPFEIFVNSPANDGEQHAPETNDDGSIAAGAYPHQEMVNGEIRYYREVGGVREYAPPNYRPWAKGTGK